MDQNNNIQKAKSVPPFVRYCSAIIPTMFDDSLSYYEALCALNRFIQTNLVDVINNNATATEEYAERVERYAELVEQLRVYVDTYFDNLDVQEEINNKLDKMTEDGTLEDIIARYIQAPATSEHLGSVKIGDGINVTEDGTISLKTASDNTIGGVKVGDGLEIDASSNLSVKPESSAGIFAMSRIQSTNKYAMMYSEDGENFLQVGTNLPDNFGHDASSLFEHNGKYYYVSSRYYRISDDLEHWSNDITFIEGSSNIDSPVVTGYGSMFYYDEASQKVYAYYARTYNEDRVTAANGATTRYFKISYKTGTFNTDGTINFDENEFDLLYVSGQSYIDPYVIKHPTLGLLIAYKDEIACKIKISTLASLSQMGATTNTCPIQGVEAPKLIMDNQGNVICYFDGYAIYSSAILNTTNTYPSVCGYFYAVLNNSLRQEQQMAAVVTSYPYAVRHVGYIRPSKKMYRDILKLGVIAFPTTCNKSTNTLRKDGKAIYDADDGSTIVNFPNVIYHVRGAKTLTIKNYFKDYPINLIVDSTTVITWSSDSWIIANSKNKTFSGLSTTSYLPISIYPDARNCLEGMLPPVDA